MLNIPFTLLYRYNAHIWCLKAYKIRLYALFLDEKLPTLHNVF